MFKAGIFDAGGVLQTYEVMEPIYQDIVSTLKISREDFDKVWKEYTNQLAINAISDQAFFKILKERTGSTEALPQESLLARKYKEFFTINMDTLAVVKELREKAIKLAVLTNSMKPHTQHNIAAGLYDHFDVRVMSDEVGMRKPDIAIYKLCLEKLGVDAQEAFMTDDKQRNLDPAAELGIKTILFTSPQQLRNELVGLGVL